MYMQVYVVTPFDPFQYTMFFFARYCTDPTRLSFHLIDYASLYYVRSSPQDECDIQLIINECDEKVS